MAIILIRYVPFLFTPVSLIFVLLTISILPASADSVANLPTISLAIAQKNILKGCFLIKDGHKVVASHNTNKLFIPASIWKIATASLAISELGLQFRYKTDFFQNSEGDIFIKGYGDPFLISEEIDIISEQLILRLKKPINNIFIDQSYFDLKEMAHGSSTSNNPYDAGNYATAVNFNTIYIELSPSLKAFSAEEQTPTLTFMQKFSKGISAGKDRVNISKNPENVNRYVNELFHSKLLMRNASNIQSIIEKPVPVDAQLIYSHHSSVKMVEIIESMLLYSNNFIANQLLLTCGASSFGPPANWQNARQVMNNFLTKNVGINKNSFSVMEGSGLSRKNLINGESMLKILQYFKPHSNLIPLKGMNRVKSGTLKGVHSYAGYLQNNYKELPFVIMLNQANNTRDIILKSIISMLKRDDG